MNFSTAEEVLSKLEEFDIKDLFEYKAFHGHAFGIHHRGNPIRIAMRNSTVIFFNEYKSGNTLKYSVSVTVDKDGVHKTLFDAINDRLYSMGPELHEEARIEKTERELKSTYCRVLRPPPANTNHHPTIKLRMPTIHGDLVTELLVDLGDGNEIEYVENDLRKVFRPKTKCDVYIEIMPVYITPKRWGVSWKLHKVVIKPSPAVILPVKSIPEQEPVLVVPIGDSTADKIRKRMIKSIKLLGTIKE